MHNAHSLPAGTGSGGLTGNNHVNGRAVFQPWPTFASSSEPENLIRYGYTYDKHFSTRHSRQHSNSWPIALLSPSGNNPIPAEAHPGQSSQPVSQSASQSASLSIGHVSR